MVKQPLSFADTLGAAAQVDAAHAQEPDIGKLQIGMPAWVSVGTGYRPGSRQGLPERALSLTRS